MQGRQVSQLSTDRFLYLALQRLVEIIGEAAGRVSLECRTEHREIPWAVIKGMRNRLVHGYDVVDPETLWGTILLDVPGLIPALEQLLAGE